jgi:hypothetical protein
MGLLGSTAWAEQNAAYLQSHVIAYLNVDVGRWGEDEEREKREKGKKRRGEWRE